MVGLSSLPVSIQNLIAFGIKQVSPKRIWLYGSRARGTARPLSDFDLAFEFDASARHDWVRFLADADDLPITLREFDLLDLNTAPEELRESVLNEGVILYERA